MGKTTIFGNLTFCVTKYKDLPVALYKPTTIDFGHSKTKIEKVVHPFKQTYFGRGQVSVIWGAIFGVRNSVEAQNYSLVPRQAPHTGSPSTQ